MLISEPSAAISCVYTYACRLHVGQLRFLLEVALPL